MKVLLVNKGEGPALLDIVQGALGQNLAGQIEIGDMKKVFDVKST
jgi:hypothetical protein